MTSLESRQERSSKRRADAAPAAESQSASGASSSVRSHTSVWLAAGLLFLGGATAGVTSQWWWPQLWVANGTAAALDDSAGDPTAVGDATDGGTTLALSAQGRK